MIGWDKVGELSIKLAMAALFCGAVAGLYGLGVHNGKVSEREKNAREALEREQKFKQYSIACRLAYEKIPTKGVNTNGNNDKPTGKPNA